MYGKVFTSALFAGFAAGLIAAALQLYFVQPVLLHAELYEGGDLTHSGSESTVATPPSNPSASLQTGNGPSHGRRAGQARVAAREAARVERREAEMQNAASQAADMIARMNAARRADQAVRAFGGGGGTKKGDENA